MNYKPTLEQWQDAIQLLDDYQFFEIIRIYLGEVKTPYNKQRLTQQMVNFLLNEENQKNIISLLDSFDLTLITAVYYISNPTKDLLSNFFSENFPVANIYSGLSNLVARLILFVQKDESSKKTYYRINPLLEGKLIQLINLKYILEPCNIDKFEYDDAFSISPNFLAAFVSFLNNQGCACKLDGELKKADIQKIKNVFPKREGCIRLLIDSFLNLLLLKETEKKFIIDYERLIMFSRLPLKTQYALLTVASTIHLGRDNLKRFSEVFLNTMQSLPPEGNTIGGIRKIALLAYSNNNGSSSERLSRFTKIIQTAKGIQSDRIGPIDNNCSVSSIIQMIFESAIIFGLLIKKGIDANGNNIYVKSDSYDFVPTNQKALNVDSTFTITILPSLSFEELIPLTRFLKIVSCSVTTQFELSKQSVSLAFDKGIQVDSILGTIKRYSTYDIPQSLRENIIQWYDQYESAKVYYGCFLKVTGKNITIVENNPKITSHIREKLCDGVYLLDFPQDYEIDIFLAENGVELLGSIKTEEIKKEEKISFPNIDSGSEFYLEDRPLEKLSFTEGKNIIQGLKSKLQDMDVNNEVRNNLLNRINQRVIVSLDQLATTSTRLEILEATGTDYNGKVHLIEAAMKTKDALEIIIPDEKKESTYITLVGNPLGITKQDKDSVARFKIEPEHNIQNFLVSKITHIKRLRF